MQQLSSLTLVLRPSAPVDKAHRARSLGPFLQGALMEQVDTAYAAYLHQLPLNPYSQYCTWEGDDLVWRVNALTTEAATYVLDPIRRLSSIELRGAGATFEVTKSSQETVPLKALTDAIGEPGEPRVRVRFVTPTSFKSQGSYVIMPSARLVLQNLLMHYGQVYEDSKDGYEETIEYLSDQVRIGSYNLRSSYFGHAASGGKKIPAFVGTATLSLRGPAMAMGLARMLLRFGEYAGVGIKTSMGMGGFRLI